jgi:putative ABC transport system ATP-binding protein
LPLLYSNASNIKLKVSTALSQVGLTDRSHHKPTELSGGQQQRVGIARALVKNPSILLADEPTGNLDSESGNEIMKIIQNLNRETGLTVIIVTHETSIAKYTDRIISVLDGSIVSDIRQKAATVTT